MRDCALHKEILYLWMVYCLNVFNFSWIVALPVGKLNVSRSDIRNGDLLPPDHVAGAHIEHDGHINKDFHHEAFLGTLIKEGKLVFENLEGYKRLIDIYHQVDVDKNHRIDNEELTTWIHARIMEHYNAAKNESDHVFLKVDHNNDGYVLWAEYKAQLLGYDPNKFGHDNTSLINDKDGDFAKEVKHWTAADYNKDNQLDQHEFLAFYHPEHNKETLGMMADEMLESFDRNKDGKISAEEFTALPEGEVDAEYAELDKQYQQEREREFQDDMDSNNDNVITRDELMTYLDPRHMQHAVKEAKYLIKTSDRDRDGKISEHEMLVNYNTFTGSGFTDLAKVLHDEF